MRKWARRAEHMAEQVARGLWFGAMLLAVVMIVMAVLHNGRSQETAAQVLMTQGDTLIRVLEAGSRMGFGRGELFGLGRVMEDLAGRREVEAVVILGADFHPLAVAARNQNVVNSIDVAALAPESVPKFSLVEGPEMALFVVYRWFRPLRRMPHAPGEEDRVSLDPGYRELVALVALDARQYLEAGRRDRHARFVVALMGGTLVVLAGVSLFWRRRAQALQGAMAEQAQLAAVGNLAAGVAHEIRNPLSSIKGFATYFGGLFPAGSREAAMARLVVEEVGRMDRSIAELLDLARPFVLQRRAHDLAALCQAAADLVAPECAAQGIAVAVEVPGGLSVSWDSDRMRQALLNLLLNAVHAMPKGGQLTIQGRRLRDGQVELLVCDTGHGIAPEHLDRIFDPYFTTRGTGTGLGLAVTRRIIEAHGGHIEIQSQLGQGTTVRLVLPKAEEAHG